MWWQFDETEEGVRRQSVRELIRKVIPLFRPHARYLFAAFGLLVLITASQLAGPLVLQHIIDVSIPNSDLRGVIIAAALYLVIASTGAGVGYVQAITLFTLGINIVTDLKSKLFKHILHLGLDFHEKLPPGKLISRVESDTETLKELFGDVAVNLLRNLMLFVGILVVLSIKNFAIAVYILLLVPVLFAATFLFLTFMKKYWREWRAQWAIVTGYVAEYVQDVDIIQQFNYQGTARKRMDEVNLGKFRVEVSRYLGNAQYAGNSSKAWYLLADPADLPVIEVAFLNGQESPTIETAEADFGVLGIQMRWYHDFGVNLQDPRGGIKSKGEV